MEPLDFEIRSQPDDTTCGPTCLHAVYRYFGDELPLRELTDEIPSVEGGGTLCVHLANHALERGYKASIVTWNLQVFDPTWFEPEAPPIRERLEAQIAAKSDPRIRDGSRAYQRFLDLGGELSLEDLTPKLLRQTLRHGLPIVTGLSATYLYRASRERPEDHEDDDVRGEPVGHFVVLTGYVPGSQEILVTDPLHPNPLSDIHTYPVEIHRVVGAVYLGALTHDANMLVLVPPKSAPRSHLNANDRRRRPSR